MSQESCLDEGDKSSEAQTLEVQRKDVLREIREEIRSSTRNAAAFHIVWACIQFGLAIRLISVTKSEKDTEKPVQTVSKKTKPKIHEPLTLSEMRNKRKIRARLRLLGKDSFKLTEQKDLNIYIGTILSSNFEYIGDRALENHIRRIGDKLLRQPEADHSEKIANLREMIEYIKGHAGVELSSNNIQRECIKLITLLY